MIQYYSKKIKPTISDILDFGALLDTAKNVNIIFDKDVLEEEYYGGS